MKDEDKTKEQLVHELKKMRQRVVELETTEAERKRAEEALRQSENKYKTLLENLPQKIFQKDRNSVYMSCNENYARDLKIRPEEIFGKTDYEFFPKELAEKYTADDKRIIASGKTEDIEEKYLVDGQKMWVQTVKTPIKDKKGNITGVLGIFWDVTKRKRAEQALRASEERYRVLAENVADGVAILQERKFVFVNDTLSSMLGCSSDQLIGTDPVFGIRDDYRERFQETLEFLEEGIAVKYSPVPCVKGDGRELWVEWRHSFVEWKGGSAILSTVRDNTESMLREIAMKEDKERLQRENITLRSTIKDRYRLGNIVGKSHAMLEVYELILMASSSDVNVVICGESGTGKEVIARTIHELSDRCKKAFVPVNCGAIPKALFESEFFGHRKGAFTGAHMDQEGFFDFARGGTLFLDEVGELTPNMQVKLLRVIEGSGYIPVGGNRARKADVRIVAATNRDIPGMVKRGLIREDFLYRIYVIPITVPPLKDRKEDICLLVDHFLKLYGHGKKRQAIPGEILEALYNHNWPGNVRELENVLKRYITIKRLDFIGTHITQGVGTRKGSWEGFDKQGLGLRNTLEAFEKEFISKKLEENHWHRAKTAAMLGIPERTLYRKLKQFQLTLS
jgi:PAS domain S-box-containing protein